MRTEDEKTEALKTQRDPYEAAVLQCLDQEITASSKTADDTKVQVDAVDALVENLLKESMNASDTVVANQDTGGEDLDRLFSKIFKENKPALQTEASRARSVVDPRLNETLKEIGLVDRQSVDIRRVDLTPRQEAAAVVPVEMTAPTPAISIATATPPVPSPPVLQPSEGQGIHECDVVSPEPDELQKTLVFSPPPRKPVWNLQIVVIAAAFLCLLAGAGVLLFKDSKNTAHAKSGQPSASTAATTSPKVEDPVVAHPAPAPATESKSAPVRAARNVNNPTPAAVSNNGNAVNSAAPPKDGKPVAVAQPARPPVANAAINATVTADAIDKPASTVAAAVENPVANPPQRAAEATPPPPVLQTQAAPEPALAPLIPKAAANLEDPASMNRPAIQPPVQPPVLSKRVTPAVVISRVLPSYPELARRSHTTGTVVIDVLIDEKGKVTKATAVSGPAILQSEAVNAVMRWQFKPANLDGVAVPSSNQVSIVFK